MKKAYCGGCLALILFFPCHSFAELNGFAVTAMRTYCSNDGSYYYSYTLGYIVKFTIENGKVIKTDALYKDKLSSFPTLNILGNKVVFVRTDISNKSQWAQDVSKHLCVIDANGAIIQDNIDTFPSRYCTDIRDCHTRTYIDWPAGDWIYYSRRSGGGGPDDIYKVKYNDPSTKQKVCTYSHNGTGVYAFGLSLDATKATIVTSYCSDASAWYCNAPHLFPPSPSDPADPRGDWPTDVSYGCGAYISPSGNCHVHFQDQGHSILGVNTLNWGSHTATTVNVRMNPDFAQWSGLPQDSVGAGKMWYPRWSVNSDKWICANSTNAKGLYMQLLVNWVDHKVIPMPHGPDVSATACGSMDQQERNCEAGDLWVAGGPCGSYEDVNGAWVPASGITVGCKNAITANVETLSVTATAGGADPADKMVSLTLGTDAPVNPQLVVSDDAPWLTAGLEGLQVRNHIDITGLKSANYRAKVTITATDMLSESYIVAMKLDGPLVVSTIAVKPPNACIMPSTTMQFTLANILDQFGRPIANAAATWSVSGGGTINASGLFASNGSTGYFTVHAIMGDAEDSTLIFVGNGISLPPGSFKDLLCLLDSAGRPYLTTTDATAIEAKYTTAGAISPTDGESITINGNTYTWRIETSTTGIWSNGPGMTNFSSFWFTTIISPILQNAVISVGHDDEAWMWHNGTRVGSMTGYGEGQTNPFQLQAGENRIFFELHGGGASNQFSARLLAPEGQDISGLCYYPHTGTMRTEQPLQPPANVPSGPSSITARGGILRISVSSMGRHQVTILDAQGRIIRSVQGIGAATYQIDRTLLKPGIFFVGITTGKCIRVNRFTVQE
jgi:hypothetical protein